MPPAHRPRAAFAIAPNLVEPFFGVHRARLDRFVDLHPETITDFAVVDDQVMAGLDVLITGWRSPHVDIPSLERMPGLRAVIHAGGSVKSHVYPVVWERGIQVSSAAAVNAVPVAEFSMAMILLASKRVLPFSAAYQRQQAPLDIEGRYLDIGANGLAVGIVGASSVGRRLLTMLQPTDVVPLVYDPHVDEADIAALGGHKVSLERVMSCAVVSLHVPSLPETHRMIGAPELALMPEGGTLINTARGSVLDHDALLAEVEDDRLFAVLDTTDPEPLPPGHPFYSSARVLLTPHVAGSLGNELHRLGGSAVSEVERLVSGEPLRHPVRAENLLTLA